MTKILKMIWIYHNELIINNGNKGLNIQPNIHLQNFPTFISNRNITSIGNEKLYIVVVLFRSYNLIE